MTSFARLEAAEFTFFWSASTDPAVGAYGIYQRTGDSPHVKIDEVRVQDLDNPARPSYRFAGLAEGTTYRFAATSIAESGSESELFGGVCVTVNDQVVECGDNADDGATIFISCFIGSAGEGHFRRAAGR